MKDRSSMESGRTILTLACARTSRKIRKIRSLSQEEAAMRSNISQSYLSNIEQGRNLISLITLLSLTSGLDVDFNEGLDLLGNEVSDLSDLLNSYNSNTEKYKLYDDFSDLVRSNIDKDRLTPDAFL